MATVLNQPRYTVLTFTYWSIFFPSSNRKYLATSSKDRTCRLWDLSSQQCIAIGSGHTDSVGSIGISQRSSTYLSKQAAIVTGAMDKVLKRWPISGLLTQWNASEATPLELFNSHSVRAHEKDINTIAVSPNDTLVATGSQDKLIKIWKTTDLSVVATLAGHKRGVWKIVFSPVDRCLVSCSGDRTMKLWSAVDFTCLQTFEGHTASVLSVKFVNRGMQLLSGSADGLLRLWTIRTGECETVLDKHQDRVWAVATSPRNDTVFFSGGSDSRLHRWRDVTEAVESKRLEQLEESLVIEQQLFNDIQNKRFGQVKYRGRFRRCLLCLSCYTSHITQFPPHANTHL